MKKRMLSILLVFMMLVQMLPTGVFAAEVADNVIDITDISLENTGVTITGVAISKATVVSAEESATNTLDVLLAADTEAGTTVKAVLQYTGQMPTQQNGDSCTIRDDGTGTLTTSFRVIGNGGRPVGGIQYTINFSVQQGEAYDVTLPTGEGFSVTGKNKAFAGGKYTFTVALDEAYKAGVDFAVTVNDAVVGNAPGDYTVENVEGPLNIGVVGVEKKTVYSITWAESEQYVITGAPTVYENESYSFTVTVPENYNGTNKVVTVNDTPIEETEGKYTIPSVGENLTIVVTGITEKQARTVTLTNGKGYTLTGDSIAYDGESYTFSVTVRPGYVGNNMMVYVNGEPVTLTNNTYTINPVSEDITVSASGLQKVTLPETGLSVTEANEQYTIGIAEYTVASRNPNYAKVTSLKVSGTGVKAAYEVDTDNTKNKETIYVVVPYNTPDTATVSLEFGTSVYKYSSSVSNTTGSVTLSDGEGDITMTLSGKAGSNNGTATYTVVFFREDPPKIVPTRLVESDAAEMYVNTELVLDVASYFENADRYYLVSDGEMTALESGAYTLNPSSAGNMTLVFAAANPAGTCPDYVTVNVKVKELPGGVWVGYETSSGSLDHIVFKDKNGDYIEGVTGTVSGTTINVVLPQTCAANDVITAEFTLTQNDSGRPILSLKNGTTGVSSDRWNNSSNIFTKQATTLKNGRGSLTFYYCNGNPDAREWKLNYEVYNNLPALADRSNTSEKKTLTVGDKFELNLGNLFTDIDGQTLTYKVSVNDGAFTDVGVDYSYTPELAGTYTLKFKANDGMDDSEEVYTVTLTVENSTDTYDMTVSVPKDLQPTFYVFNGFGSDNTDVPGDMVATVKGATTDGMTTYTLTYPQNATMLSVRADGWGGMAFAAKENGTVSLRQLQTNVVDYENNAAECTVTVKYDAHTAVGGENGWLLVTGQEYTYTAVPKDTATLATVTETETLENGTGIYTRKIGLNIKNPVTITVPKGATAQLYKYNKYYHNTELDAKIVKDSEDGKTTSYQFIADTKANGAVYIYRVAMEGKITKAGWMKWGQQSLEVTYSDTDKSPDYRLDDYFSAGVMDDSFASEDSVLLNINSRNHLNLSVGQSKTLKAYRAWEIIPISYNNYIITPDFTYTVLSGEDVISLEKKESPSAGEGDWMTVTAKENGVAVIEVTYDAIDVSGDTRDYPYQGVYGASDPARTGLVVVQVGENDDTSVNFGIDCFTSVGISNGSGDSGTITYNPNAKKAWDAEFDTLYFTGDNGELRLQPAAGSEITEVAVSNNKGAAWTTLTEKDGVYTAKIVSGNNIIRVKTESGTAYQVVRGDKVTYSVTEVDGKSNSDGKLEVGETVRVTLNGLHMPIPKMAGNYNPGAKDIGGGNKYTKPNLSYDSNGNRVYGTGTGQYAFINTNNSIEVTIPESGRIELTEGYIGLGEIGLDLSKGDSHRNIPDEGCVTRGSNQYIYTHCILPDITIVAESVDKTVPVEEVVLGETEKTINVGESFDLTATIKPSDATVQTVTWASSNEAVVRVTENGKVTAVGVGVATVTASAGEKTVECKITVTKIPVESVTLNFTSAELQIGKTLTLTADVEPENATNRVVTWKSSNEAVAAVSSGIVTAVDEGETTITAEADGKKAVCVVTVKKPQEADSDTGKAKVYLSVSDDAAFIKTPKGAVTALREIEVPYFDLSKYGLGDFTLPETHEAYGKPTALHLYIYATEVLWCGVPDENAGQGYLYDQNLMGTGLLNLSGTPGSLTTDMFWNMDMNMNYYHNYLYPADATGYGITADRIVLNDGDIITIGHFASWDFHNDSSSAFNYIVANGNTVSASVLQGEKPVLQVYRAGKDFGAGTNTSVSAKVDIHYIATNALKNGEVTTWEKLGTTNTKGQLTADLSSLNPGTYLFAVSGRKGEENPTAVVSAPGGILVTVLEDTAAQQVKDVIGLIEKIGDPDKITLSSTADIVAARAAYNALTPVQQDAVTNYDKLEKAEDKLAVLEKAKADQDAANAAADKINKIGTVTVNSKNTIDAARSAYDALTEAQKALVDAAVLKKLNDAETSYAQLIATQADKKAAAAVQKEIEKIGEVTLAKEKKIIEVREAFDKLTDTQKDLVTNKEDLVQAEERLAELKDKAAVEAVEAKIADIGTVTLKSEAKIKDARTAYEALFEEQKAKVGNLDTLEQAEEMLELLKLAGTDITKIYTETGDYLEGLSAPGVGTQNGEWRVIGLSRAGKSVADSYYNAVVKFVQENIDENGRLHESKSTDNSRLIVALTAIGKDVTDVSGYDLLSGLNDMTYIGKQGINGTIWALIAFDTHAYDIPEGDVTREKLVSAILGKQNADGGWSLSGSTSDPDMTGMALQALAPYYSTNTEVKSAVEEALAWLSGIQTKDGMFKGSEGTTAESLAQVITALTALGINPETDSRFVKNGVSAVDALSKFYVEGGGFKHGLSGERNTMATEQGYYALVSYFRLLQEKTSLYDMSDVTVVVPVYKIIEGANSDWQKDDAALTIRADGEFAKFTGVKIDGTLVDSKHYTAKAGSTVITFKADYLKTLSEGEHTITVTFEDGEASTSVSILPSDEEVAKKIVDAIDAIGMVTENSGDKIKAARKAYDALTTEQKKLVTNYKVLTDAESTYDLLVSKISVTFTLLGCYEHDSDTVHTLSGGDLSIWIAKKTYKVESGATVKDVLEKALAEAGMSYRNPTGNYVESINGIGEFTNGSLSGWMYTLNGVHPGLGVAEQTVQDGDVIVFHYTDDYTKESDNTQYGDAQAAKFVEQMIDKLDPSSKSFESDVTAAKAAYDALTAEQKKLVKNYSKLTDAMKSLADEKDVKAAEEVEKLIDAIGAVTKDSKEAIEAAREAYDKLSAEQKALVENILLLETAEERLEKLMKAGAAEDIYKQTGDYLESLGTPGVGSIGGEWMVIGLIRSGREIEDVDAYYDAVLQFVEENIDENGRLHKAKSSENARLILALTALGKDVTNVGGHDLLKGLGNMQYVKTQGINGPIWTLIALDSGNYPVPEGDVSRDALLMTILNAQLADGGWALSGTASDPDMTGMALQALAPYYEENADVKAAVDRALQAISDMQTADGAFASIDGKCAESAAQVLAALSALGIDANTDVRFIKNGVSVLDALCAFFVKDGGFSHIPDGDLDGMATEQAYYALTAYFRMLNGECSLFDMTDIIDMGGDIEAEEPKVETEEEAEAETVPAVTEPMDAPEKADFPWWILIIAVVVIAAGSVLMVWIPVMKKKNK